jgi:hypothetical protein
MVPSLDHVSQRRVVQCRMQDSTVSHTTEAAINLVTVRYASAADHYDEGP